MAGAFRRRGAGASPVGRGARGVRGVRRLVGVSAFSVIGSQTGAMVACPMQRAVLADLHLGQREGDLARFAACVQEIVERRAEEVIFLGDLFRTLVGYPRYWDDGIRAGLDLLRGIRSRGLRVVMVEGNRDFFLDHPALGPYRDLAAEAHSFTAGGRRFLLEHGDLVNRRDRSYRLWRATSKSRLARFSAAWLPGPLARRIVVRTEARLATTNFSYRRALPVDDLEAAARRHFRAGVHVVLWGHFHDPWEYRDGLCEARVVPAWMSGGHIAWVGESGEVTISGPTPP